jgi:hypothetical protein
MTPFDQVVVAGEVIGLSLRSRCAAGDDGGVVESDSVWEEGQKRF